jgi:leader peptidase (prepilin peptidase)/N-methyltransferase
VLLTIAVSTGDYAALLRAGLGGLVMFVGYTVLALVPGGQIGFGDVKAAGVLGLLLGWLGWGYVLLGAALPHLLNGPVVVGLLLTGRVKRNSPIALGPALLAGALLAIVILAGRHAAPLW